MRPVLFRIRGVPFHAYPTMLYVGLVAGMLVANVAARAYRLDAFRAYVATLLLLLPAIAGTRLLFVASEWRRYRGDLRRVWSRAEGGASQYGALLVALPLSAPVVAALGVPFGAFWDATAFGILTVMIFTRVGCLLNGCCAGRPSLVWGAVSLPNRAGVWARRMPTQCLEAGWAAVLLTAAMAWRDGMPFPGALCALAAGGYGAGRLVLESMREQPARAAITINHVLSLVAVAASTVVLATWWPR